MNHITAAIYFFIRIKTYKNYLKVYSTVFLSIGKLFKFEISSRNTIFFSFFQEVIFINYTATFFVYLFICFETNKYQQIKVYKTTPNFVIKFPNDEKL